MARQPSRRRGKAFGAAMPDDESMAAAREVIDRLVPAGWRVLTWTSHHPVKFVVDYEEHARRTSPPWGVHLMAADHTADLDVLGEAIDPDCVWGLHLGYRPLRHTEVLSLDRYQWLEQLDLSGSNLVDDDLLKVATLTALLQLKLSDTAVSDAGVAHLATLQHLRVINLIGTRVTDACIDTLEQLPELNHVAVASTAVTEAGIERLAAMPNMRVLRTPRLGLFKRLRLAWRHRHVSVL